MRVAYIVPIVVVIIAVVSYLSLKNKRETKRIEVIGVKDFYCQDISGFSFKYPVFKDWNATEFKKDGQYGCKMFFDNPLEISYEIARQMGVYVVSKTENGKDGNGENNLSGTKMNKNGVNYKLIENGVGEFPDAYEFYGKDFDVRIAVLAGTEKEGFSEETFWQTVADSFAFSR